MSATDYKPLLLIWGTYQDTENYPNTRYRLQFLRSLKEFEVEEIAAPAAIPGWGKRLATGRLALACCTMALAHLRLLWRMLTLKRRPNVAYIPYPAVMALTVLRLLPQRLRPKRVIADAFISIHDTVVNDRKLLRPRSILSRLLHWWERAAYRQADTIIVDTQMNADFITSRFGLDPTRIVALPLSTNEIDYKPQPYHPTGNHFTILFIGTMIPLHGIETVLKAAKLLEPHPAIRFRLIGNGQQAFKIETAIRQGASNLWWQKNWLSAQELAEEIASADICLGIFDAGEKAQRVCPYKVYAYSTVGRAIITARTAWIESASSDIDHPPYHLVEAGNSDALASAILGLLQDDALRVQYADNSRRFYANNLCNAISHNQLKALLH